MGQELPASDWGRDTLTALPYIHDIPINRQVGKDSYANLPAAFRSSDRRIAAIEIPAPRQSSEKNDVPLGRIWQTRFMVIKSLTQLLQLIPLRAGINSSLALGAAVGATAAESVWIVASYPLTQGSFVLIGEKLDRV